MRHERRGAWIAAALAAAAVAGSGCGHDGAVPERASGYVETTEVRVAPETGGRLLEVSIREGDRVAAGTVIARLDETDSTLALRRAQAERDHALAQLRLLQAGARGEEVRQARAQESSAEAETSALEAELQAARADLARFEGLLASNAGSRKQRDDAATRLAVAEARVSAARERARAAGEGLARIRAGARTEEIAAARARVAAAEAQIATLDKSRADATLRAPVSGFVTAKLADAGEMIARGTPVAVISDLDHPWANVYVDAPAVPRLKLGQKVPLVTDDGGRLEGTITYISPKAEFTPRNVQTADERTKLVYRIKVTADNRDGVLKPGMPVEAEIPR